MVLRLGIVGSGRWGINHVRAATKLERAELVAVCDISPRARERAVQVARGVQTIERAEDLLRNPAIDAVILASPSSTHGALTRAALAAGKHVLVEKPFVLSLAEGVELVELAAAERRTLMVGHILRYHPYFRHLLAQTRAGELGRLQYVYSERVNLGTVRSDENAFWSLAPHDLSMMCALMEAPPVEISSLGQAFVRPGVEDVVFATIRFADGGLGHIHTSWIDQEKRRRLTVVGDKRMAVFDDMEPSEKLRIYGEVLRPEEALTALPFFHPRRADIHIPAIPMIEPLLAEQQHFVDCVQDQRTPESDGQEALAVTRCLVAATESLRAGGKPVRL
ncbi:MAG: Gfo/Idh/MocA family oxidoreductase [Myxococcota bacterium]